MQDKIFDKSHVDKLTNLELLKIVEDKSDSYTHEDKMLVHEEILNRGGVEGVKSKLRQPEINEVYQLKEQQPIYEQSLIDNIDSIRYPNTTRLLFFYKMLSYTCIAFGFISGIITISILNNSVGFLLMLALILSGIIGYVGFMSKSEIMRIMIDIEFNTRKFGNLLSNKPSK